MLTSDELNRLLPAPHDSEIDERSELGIISFILRCR
jgi:hypothetical protein